MKKVYLRMVNDNAGISTVFLDLHDHFQACSLQKKQKGRIREGFMQ